MFFAAPDNLYWLLALVPMTAAAIWYLYWTADVRDSIGDPALVEAMAESRSQGLRALRLGLVIAGVALLCLAAAEPKWGRSSATIEKSGIDLVFGLDLSKSMLARDVSPSRLEAATGEIETVLDRLGGDRVGMVVFTSVSFVQSPLTADYGAIRFYLEKLDPSQMSVGGTAIGSALRDSVELLTGESFGGGDSQATRSATLDRAENQVVVLFTDGEDHASDPVAAAKEARKRGIRVVTVGLGTDEGAKIPIETEDGAVRGYKRNRNGDIVTTALQEKQLRNIARAGGGTHIRYDGENSVANRLRRFVDELEASRLDSQIARQYHDRYLWFALPAFVLILVSFLLGERSKGRLGWSRDGGSTLLVLSLLFAGMGLSGCDAPFRAPHEAVESGNQRLENGDLEGALESYDRAERQLEPVPGRLHFNRGVALLGLEQLDKARRAFGDALGSDDPSVRFDAHHGIGLAFSRKKEWKKAVDAYERALRLLPAHSDDLSEDAVTRARHNLELAYHELYPPCSSEEDDLEENDEPSRASRLKKKPKREDLTLCGLDDDWFAISASPGAKVTVEATFRRLGDHADPEHDFLPNPEDLALELYGADGETRLASDIGGSEAESRDSGPVERKISKFSVDEETPLGPDSTLYVRLAAADQLEFSYDLSIDVQPPCRALQEKGEPNDARGEARRLEAGAHRMQLCPGDRDWFRVEAEMGDSVFVDIKPTRTKRGPEPAKPDELRLTMFDADSGERVGDPRREGPFWTAGLHEVRRDGNFRFRVDAPSGDVETSYTARVYVYPPCMAGDDRFEENDELERATTFDKRQRRQRHYRYLRLCPDDPDYFALQPPEQRSGSGPSRSGKGRSGSKKPKPLKLGLRLAPPPDGPDPSVSFAAYDPSTGSIRTQSETPDAPEPSAQKSTESGASTLDRILQAEVSGSKRTIPVGVSGDATFYHLSKLNSGGSDNRKNRKDQKNQNNQKKRRNQDRRSSNRNESQSNENQKRDENNQKRRSKRDKRSENQRKKKQRDTERERRVEDILKALENSDENFQMRKALEQQKRRGGDVDKDW